MFWFPFFCTNFFKRTKQQLVSENLRKLRSLSIVRLKKLLQPYKGREARDADGISSSLHEKKTKTNNKKGFKVLCRLHRYLGHEMVSLLTRSNRVSWLSAYAQSGEQERRKLTPEAVYKCFAGQRNLGWNSG